MFGQTDAGQNYYSLVVSAGLGQATLFRMVDGRVVPIVDWVLIPAIDRQGGVNRVVVRVDGGEIRANVNGQDLFTATGQQVPRAWSA